MTEEQKQFLHDSLVTLKTNDGYKQLEVSLKEKQKELEEYIFGEIDAKNNEALYTEMDIKRAEWKVINMFLAEGDSLISWLA